MAYQWFVPCFVNFHNVDGAVITLDTEGKLLKQSYVVPLTSVVIAHQELALALKGWLQVDINQVSAEGQAEIIFRSAGKRLNGMTEYHAWAPRSVILDNLPKQPTLELGLKE